MNEDKIKQLITETDSAKHDLIRLMDKIEELNPTKAKQLGHIISKLEVWQRRSK